MLDTTSFHKLSGKNQIEYLDGLGYDERSAFFVKNLQLIKANAPAPKAKYSMPAAVIAFFINRKHPFNPDSIFKRGANLSGMNFSQTNITAKQLLEAGDCLSACCLPNNMDFTDCVFAFKDISEIDFSKTNINDKQFCQTSLVSEFVKDCKLPNDIDFSKTNITLEQIKQAGHSLACKFPKYIYMKD